MQRVTFVLYNYVQLNSTQMKHLSTNVAVIIFDPLLAYKMLKIFFSINPKKRNGISFWEILKFAFVIKILFRISISILEFFYPKFKKLKF